jgi:hypothetical protein
MYILHYNAFGCDTELGNILKSVRESDFVV